MERVVIDLWRIRRERRIGIPAVVLSSRWFTRMMASLVSRYMERYKIFCRPSSIYQDTNWLINQTNELDLPPVVILFSHLYRQASVLILSSTMISHSQRASQLLLKYPCCCFRFCYWSLYCFSSLCINLERIEISPSWIARYDRNSLCY